MKKEQKIVKGNKTTVSPDEKVTPIYNETYPAMDIGQATDGKWVKRYTEKNASRLRKFSIENKK